MRRSPARLRGRVGAQGWGMAGGPPPVQRQAGGGLRYLTGPSPCLQRSFTLIVEAWDWDNDTTLDGE